MKLFPSGPWFGLTRKRLRAAAWTFAVLSVLCAALYGAARTAQALEYRRAGAFLEELKRIQPGQSELSVMPFIQHYQGIRAEQELGSKDDSYIVRLDPWHLMRSFPGPDWADHSYRWACSEFGNWRRALKLRSWTANGQVAFADGKVNMVSGGLVLEGENEWLMAEWYDSAEIPAYRLSRSTENSLSGQEPRYAAHWTHLHFGHETGEGIISSVTPLGTSEELNAARNINLQCLMNGRGCHSLCELMPDAARYRREHGGGWGWNSGSWGMQPHDCQ